MSGTIIPHTLARPPGLVDCRTVLDVGAGVRPMQWFRPERHLCIEPFDRYADILRSAGYEVQQARALDAMLHLLVEGARFEAVMLLDVIEHMDKAEGDKVLGLALALATRQVVVVTPDGFTEQTHDAWGYGGHAWQTHRSGWTRADFGFGFDVQRVVDAQGAAALIALWTAP
jgi:hypothetical protein